METTVNERFNLLIENYSQGNVSSFESKIGLNVRQIVGGRKSKPGHEIFESILKTFPEVSGDWLILGQGEMIKSIDVSKMSMMETIIEQLKEQLRKMETELERYKKTHDFFMTQLQAKPRGNKTLELPFLAPQYTEYKEVA